MTNQIKTFVSLVLGILAFFLGSCSENPQSALYQEIKSSNKLVFATMTVTKVAKIDKSEWYTVGKRIAVYSYNTYMNAYIDLSKLQLDDLVFDEENKTVKVSLPPVVTEIIGRDMEMKKEYDNIGIARFDIDSKDRAEAKEKANEDFKKEVEDNPIFKAQLKDAAQRKAREYFEIIFEGNGYTASIDFKNN